MIRAFVGNDGFKKEAAIDAAVKEWLGDRASDTYARTNVFPGDSNVDESVAQRVYQLCESTSMFAEKSVVVLWNFEKLKSGDQEEIFEYVKNPNPETALFIEAEKLDGRKGLGKYLSKEKLLQKFEQPYADKIPPWIVQQARDEYSKVISIQDAGYLWELVGSDLAIVNRELQKLALYLKDSPTITAEVIHETVASQREATVFELQNAFGNRDIDKAILILKSLLENGQHPILITNMLYKHYSTLLMTEYFVRHKMAPDAIAKEVGMNPYIFKNINNIPAQSKKRPASTFRRILIRLAEIEWKLKLGEFSKFHEFETALIQMI
ncbi:MAG: DNA polymerase III subunit delta [Fibrobacterales bacterium]